MSIEEAIKRAQIELIKNDPILSHKEISIEESLQDAENIADLTILKIKLKGKSNNGNDN